MTSNREQDTETINVIVNIRDLIDETIANIRDATIPLFPVLA